MKQSRRTFLAVVGAAIATGGVIFLFAKGPPDPQDTASGKPVAVQSTPVQIAPVNTVKVSIASSVTKQKWMAAAVKSFAEKDIRTTAGNKIAIDVSPVLSGDSLLQIANGSLKPTVWSPGEQTWVDQLGEKWALQHPKPAMSQDCSPTIFTPVGFAMWRPMAEALGWPAKPIGMRSLVELANDPAGWARYGHPEWGRLRLGHTHPQYSSAGLLFLATAIYAELGKTSGLSTEEVYSAKVETALSTLAKNTSKYGMVTTDLLNKMAEAGPSFLHVSAAFEEGTIRFNREREKDLRWPLVFIFPSEGTFWSDHPYCILDQTDWVTPEQAEAARLFLDYLKSDLVQADAGNHFLRPLDQSAAVGPMLSRENGTDPSATPKSIPPLSIPTPEVSELIIDQFFRTKRKATVYIALDVSGSMTGQAIKNATEATAKFISRLQPTDRVGLMVFGTDAKMITAAKPVSEIADQLQSTVKSLIAEGNTNLNGAVCLTYLSLRDALRNDVAAGDNRVYGMVLLSDGADTAGKYSETQVFNDCLDVDTETEPLKIFAIAFGEQANTDVLKRLALQTRGAMFKSDPASIDATYLRISAEQ